MKRILSLLLIALLASSAVFAQWNFTGDFDIGYTFGFDGNNELTVIDGDNDAPNAGFLKLGFGNEYLTLDVRSEVNVGNIVRNGGTGMTATLNMSNLLSLALDIEMPVGLNFYLGNQNPESDADYAYADPHGIDDEISLGSDRKQYPFGASVSYGSFITAYAYGALDVGNGGNAGAFFEVRTEPVEGIRANIAYAASALDTAQDFQVSALADIGTLLDLGFSLDVSASYVANIDHAKDNSHFMAAVTGEVAGFGAYVEYEYYNDVESEDVRDNENNLYIGASYDLDEIAVPLSFGAELVVSDMANDAAFGGSVDVTASILDLNLYAELGIEDFSDGDTGYVTVGTYIYF